jgi:hypothetical protein
MKQLQKTRISISLILCFLTTIGTLSAQEKTAPQPLLTLSYFTRDNNIQYLMLQTRIKVERKFQPLPGEEVTLFLDSIGAEKQVIKTHTDDNGVAKVIIPPSLKSQWDNNSKHTFIGVLQDSSSQDVTTTELEITKAKMEIDTSNEDGARTVNVKIISPENGDWLPVKGVDVKVGITRLGGILSAGDEAIYTTDENGTATVTFNKDSIPGDEQGNVVLTARVEDNDQFGNLTVNKKVPWGVAMKPDKSFFNQRTLWSTRFRTPFWLLFMAYATVAGVWGTLIYLVFQIVKIKKIGVAETGKT